MSCAMKRTKVLMKVLLDTDVMIDVEQKRLIMEVLEGRMPQAASSMQIPRVIHRREVMDRLGVCSRTVDNLLARQVLMPVYGIGKKVIGYTEESVRAMVEARHGEMEVRHG